MTQSELQWNKKVNIIKEELSHHKKFSKLISYKAPLYFHGSLCLFETCHLWPLSSPDSPPVSRLCIPVARSVAMARRDYLLLPVGVVLSTNRFHQPRRQQWTCNFAVLKGRFTSHGQFWQHFSCQLQSFDRCRNGVKGQSRCLGASGKHVRCRHTCVSWTVSTQMA